MCERIRLMASAILNTREFCGNEREAAIDASREYDGEYPQPLELANAFQEADQEWACSQEACGVRPLTFEERQRAYRVLA